MDQNWQEKFSIDEQPTLEDMKEFAAGTYFERLFDFLTENYHPKFSIEYSKEKGAFGGWNLKAKKYGGNLGTIYFREDCVRMMVVVSELFEEDLSATISSMSEQIQKTYMENKPVMGGFWFVVDITSRKNFEDLKYLITLRVRKLKKN